MKNISVAVIWWLSFLLYFAQCCPYPKVCHTFVCCHGGRGFVIVLISILTSALLNFLSLEINFVVNVLLADLTYPLGTRSEQDRLSRLCDRP